MSIAKRRPRLVQVSEPASSMKCGFDTGLAVKVMAKIPICVGLLLAPFVGVAMAAEHRIEPESNLQDFLGSVAPGDAIVLADGVWTDRRFRFDRLNGTPEAPIHIRAQTPGGVVLRGEVEFCLSGRHVTVSGLRFENPVSVSDVFQFRTHSDRHAHHCRITDCSFEQHEGERDASESRWVGVYGTSNRVDHCYFAGKRNRGTTLVVWVSDTVGNHRIDHNHFGPRPVLGKNGGETIRIGTSDVSEQNSRTVVEANHFQRCDGEAEIISNKSCENIYRHNLFDRCSGALTLRHGHRCLVDGNVFLGHAERGTG
ncbi:MAG: polysaccharide lyase 6 family protein, partial [Planctomycetota bacterium]